MFVFLSGALRHIGYLTAAWARWVVNFHWEFFKRASARNYGGSGGVGSRSSLSSR